MLIRPIREDEKQRYNSVVNHPMQSWEWGEFREATKLKVERVGFFPGGNLSKALQVTFHPIPVFGKTAGYFPKGDMPDDEQLSALKQLAQQNNALFIKMEPNVAQKVGNTSAHKQIHQFLLERGAVPGRPLFTRHTFQLDLTQSEEKLFSNLKSKTRYNVNLAHKKGVQIVEDSTAEGMEKYIKILQETTKRQGFYAHSPDYFRTMWQKLSGSGMIRIFHAVYQDEIISSWVMFLFNGVLYYPYGASRSIHRNVMASNLMMWEMIKFGKSQGCRSFDMWGSLGPDAKKSNSWYGFHKFKEGYNGDLVEFLGTYDLVMDKNMYKLFRIVENLRWKYLRLRTKLPF